jgi:hypothetical protein
MDNSRFKFRAWDKATNRMLETGFHILGEVTCFDIITQKLMEEPLGKTTLERIGDVIIMQWTGFKDDKGIDIYEGDIIKVFSSSVKYYEVFFKNGTFRLRYQLDSGEFYDWGPLFRLFEIATEKDIQTTIEVIGKIYSNPELLNK